MSDKERAGLTLEPQESPAYGGGCITIKLPDHTPLNPSLQHYIYIEGSSQCHACTAKIVDDVTLQSCIPDHDSAETVKFIVLQQNHDNETIDDLFTIIAQNDFTYLHDSAYHVAQFLLENADDSDILEKLDPENFEYVSRPTAHDSRSFDIRLSLALAYIGLPHHWVVVRRDAEGDLPSKETLLHFAARFGLVNVSAYFLDKPGGDFAKYLPNRHGYDPKDVAILYGFNEVADLYSRNTSSSHLLKDQNIVTSTNAGCFIHSPDGTITLTTIPAFTCYTMDDTIDMLRKYCDTLTPAHQYRSSSSRVSPDQHLSLMDESHDTMSYYRVNEASVNQSEHNNVAHTPALGSHSYTGAQSTKNITIVSPSDTDDNSDSVFNSRESLHGKHINGLANQNDISDWIIGDDSVADHEIMEDSMKCLRGINLDLQQIRDRDRNVFLNIQEDRRNNLKRLSASCPTLDADAMTAPLSPVMEEGHFIPAWESESSTDASEPLSISSLARHLEKHTKRGSKSVDMSGEQHSAIQIIINDEHLDPSEDLGQLYADGGLRKPLKHCKPWSVDSGDKINGERRSKVNMFATNGKSSSLTSLDSDTEDNRNTSDLSDRSRSSLDSTDNHTSTPSVALLNQYNMVISDERNLSYSSSSLSYHLKQPYSPILHGSSSDISNDTQSSFLSPPTMHKSVSSPDMYDDNTDINSNLSAKEKQQHAQIRRQAGIEEDEDESLNQLLKADDARNKRMSILTLMHDSADSEERPSKTIKDEKRRKSGVLSLLSRGSYRVKKGKERFNVKSSTHQFVSVSVSNSTLCGVCGKSLANKSALRCEACMLNVHENSCKDQISICSRYRTKVPLDRPASVSTSLSREQPPTSSSLSVKHVQSFKEKRSSSTPARTQPIITASSASLIRSSTSPNGRVISEEVDGGDRMGPSVDVSSSNITDRDAISVSMESLDDGMEETAVFDDDPELAPLVAEPEAWSVTVDSKVLKKMNSKDIKRQDTIWELIQTEVHHCRALKTLQKLYRRGMATELLLPSEILDKIFPRLDDLVDFHMVFLAQLQQLQTINENKSVDAIGPLLVERFSGEHGDRMATLYGDFCSQQKDSVKIFKDLVQSDRKFYAFIKKCDMHAYAQKREIPGFILLVSQRITKYPILVETILKSTKDKKDREYLIEALKLSKEILIEINSRVDAHIKQLRLIEICDKIDSRPTTYRGRKFRKTDMLENNRKLIHEGMIGLKSSRGKLLDVTALVLSDLIVFLQENNQKYTFVTQDTKPSALSLYRLFVREKSDTRDTRGIFLISQNKQEAAMYELICKSDNQRQSWINILRTAIEMCPTQEDVRTETEHERQVHEVQQARSTRIREIIDLLHSKDQQIKIVCDDKNRLFSELLEAYNGDMPHQMLLPQEDEPPDHEVSDVLLAAIEEASRLTVMLQANGGVGVSSLSRSVSSAGEHVSASYPLIPHVPKRAETFAGFDHHDVQKGIKKRMNLMSIDCDNTSHDRLSCSHINDLTDRITDDSLMPSSFNKSPSPTLSRNNLSDYDDPDTKLSDRSSDRGSSLDEQDSLGDLVMPFHSPMAMTPQDQVISFTQLGQYLHTIVHLTAQQGTAVESLRAQLHEANEKINKLSAEMGERNSSTNRDSRHTHNQLEELRNLQESINRQRQDFEKERNDERLRLDQEEAALVEKRVEFDMEKNDLKNKREELRMDRERLQKQVDLWQEKQQNNNNSTVSPSDRHSTTSIHSNAPEKGPSSDQISHLRSKSEPHEMKAKPTPEPRTSIESPPDTSSAILKRESSRKKPTHSASFISRTNNYLSSVAGGNKAMPSHLLSLNNEKRIDVANRNDQKSNVQQMLPSKLLSTSSLNNNAQAMQSQHVSMRHNSSTSSLGLVRKLAEPSTRDTKSRVTSQQSLEKYAASKMHESRSTSQLDDHKRDRDEIYL